MGELGAQDTTREEAWARRQSIWRKAMSMCQADKSKFKSQINSVVSTIKMMSQPIQWAPFTEVRDDLIQELDQYVGETNTLIK